MTKPGRINWNDVGFQERGAILRSLGVDFHKSIALQGFHDVSFVVNEAGLTKEQLEQPPLNWRSYLPFFSNRVVEHLTPVGSFRLAGDKKMNVAAGLSDFEAAGHMVVHVVGGQLWAGNHPVYLAKGTARTIERKMVLLIQQTKNPSVVARCVEVLKAVAHCIYQ